MNEIIGTDSPISRAQQESLKEIIGYMIPAGYGRPAASDDSIFAAIVLALGPYSESVERVLALHKDMDLSALSSLRNPDLSVLVTVVVQCYYRDARVMRAIDMDPRPPHPQGYDVDEGDFSLLDAVRQRGQIYRDSDS